ncbi:MAG TPA: hypothetical protein VLS44_09470 [Nitrospira sp.]|nr:hypothetical protein [Nitrospira sp.]
MTGHAYRPLQVAWNALNSITLAVLLLAGCSRLPFDPTPVVPTTSPLPYSAKVKVSEVGTYEVTAGASMSPDPTLANHVLRTTPTLFPSKDPVEWERATVEYLTARKTFQKIVQEGAADLNLTLRINMYIDPSVSSSFSQIYLVTTDGTLSDPKTGRSLASYSGFGKTAGNSQDKAAMERALHASFRDLFGKMENDKRLPLL